MTITAKYPGKCGGCGQSFAAGSKVEWAKGDGAKHVGCAGGAAAPAPKTYGQRIEASRAKWGARRGMGSGHGSAGSVPGYSSYCTDNDSCRCFDCAS